MKRLGGTALADESTHVGHKLASIVFLKSLLTAKRHLLAFRLIWLNWKL